MTDKTMEYVDIPDDEPRQIVCTGDEPGDDVWQPAFGTWAADEFGMNSDERIGDGERLFVNRRLFDALFAERDALKTERDRLREEVNLKTGIPDNDRSVLLAFKWSGGIGFCVAQRWYCGDHDDKVWLDAIDRDKVCCDDEVLGWWELTAFETPARAALRNEEDRDDD